MKTMMTVIANIFCFLVIDLPCTVYASVRNNFGKWWYSHYH
jgi:hypothetical protein